MLNVSWKSPGNLLGWICRHSVTYILDVLGSHRKHCFSARTSVPSALEVYLYTTMRYINQHFNYFFTNRVVNMRNSLPNSVVHAECTNIFKKRLDKFWSNQEVIYNYHSEIQGTGSRSVIN